MAKNCFEDLTLGHLYLFHMPFDSHEIQFGLDTEESWNEKLIPQGIPACII